jgi:hypothetical protein
LKTLVNLCFNLIWSIEMNEQTKKVVQQALEALENRCGMDAEEREELMPALRQLLEQPQPAAWVGLTDEEFDDLRDNNFGVSPLISAVEAKLREKNGY